MEEKSKFIYLNNAATSWPKPECVAEAMAEAVIQRPGAMNRGGLESFDVFEEVRKELAPLLGVSKPGQIALGSNATWGLNLALFGFDYQNKNVVTTKAEHNSVLRPLYELEQRGVLKVIYVDTDETGRVPLQSWKKAMEEYQPALAVWNHASNVTGAIQDAAKMTELAKAVGAKILIDASQTLGLVNIEAEKWGVDMVAFTGHKYLLGPQGTGGLWVSEALQLNPHMVGGTGIKSDMDTMPEEMPLHLEAGTGNEPSYHGLLAALRWRKEHPFDNAVMEESLTYLRQGLKAAGAKVIIPEGACTPVVSFIIPGEAVADVGYILQESYDMICRTGLHCAPKLFECLGVKETVRLSLSRFTTKEELDAVIEAVEDIIG